MKKDTPETLKTPKTDFTPEGVEPEGDANPVGIRWYDPTNKNEIPCQGENIKEIKVWEYPVVGAQVLSSGETRVWFAPTSELQERTLGRDEIREYQENSYIRTFGDLEVRAYRSYQEGQPWEAEEIIVREHDGDNGGRVIYYLNNPNIQVTVIGGSGGSQRLSKDETMLEGWRLANRISPFELHALSASERIEELMVGPDEAGVGNGQSQGVRTNYGATAGIGSGSPGEFAHIPKDVKPGEISVPMGGQPRR